MTLKWAGQSPVTVTVCEENGYATDKSIAYDRGEGQVIIHIEASSAYTIVTR